MRILELQLDALMRLCAAKEESERLQARNEVQQMLEKQLIHRYCSDPEYLIRELLLELGSPDHLLGHAYVVKALLLAVENRDFLDSLTLLLYPRLAADFHTTPARIERAIRNLIDVTWTRGALDVLDRYFGNTISPDKGRPTNSEFLARIANIVILRMKEAS